jgi:hypothetical protein
MIRITDQYFWNFVFGVFFVGIFVMGMIILDTEAYLTRETLTVVDVLLITLATFRLTRLFVYDAITKFIREQFLDVEVAARGNKMTLVKPKTGPRRTLADLFSCPWCFGLWAASTITFFYLLTPMAHFPTLVLAIAGVATFIQLLANMVGWKAEQLKKDVEG